MCFAVFLMGFQTIMIEFLTAIIAVIITGVICWFIVIPLFPQLMGNDSIFSIVFTIIAIMIFGIIFIILQRLRPPMLRSRYKKKKRWRKR